MGLDIREKWTIGGTLPGEPPEAREIGLDVPRSGLYLREDCDMKCNLMLTSFVRKNLDNAHKVLVERILKKAERIEDLRGTVRMGDTGTSGFEDLASSPSIRNSFNPNSSLSPNPVASRFQPGSHMSHSAILNQFTSPQGRPTSPQMLNSQHVLQQQHPAFRNDAFSTQSPDSGNRLSVYSRQGSSGNNLPPYQAMNQRQSQYYHQDMVKQGLRPDSIVDLPKSGPRQFVAELPGSTYHVTNFAPSPQSMGHDNRTSYVSELSGSEGPRSPMEHNFPQNPNNPSEIGSSNSGHTTNQGQAGGYKYNPGDFSFSRSDRGGGGGSDRQSMISEMPTPDPRTTTFAQGAQQQQQHR